MDTVGENVGDQGDDGEDDGDVGHIAVVVLFDRGFDDIGVVLNDDDSEVYEDEEQDDEMRGVNDGYEQDDRLRDGNNEYEQDDDFESLFKEIDEERKSS